MNNANASVLDTKIRCDLFVILFYIFITHHHDEKWSYFCCIKNIASLAKIKILASCWTINSIYLLSLPSHAVAATLCTVIHVTAVFKLRKYLFLTHVTFCYCRYSSPSHCTSLHRLQMGPFVVICVDLKDTPSTFTSTICYTIVCWSIFLLNFPSPIHITYFLLLSLSSLFSLQWFLLLSSFRCI